MIRFSSLKYGDGQVDLPESVRDAPILARPEPAPLRAAAEALRASLAQPVAGPSLAEFVRKHAPVVVVLPDASRPMPVDLVEGLLDAVLEAGGGPSAIASVRIANGTHRRSTMEERARLLGRHASGAFDVGDRDCDDPAAHASFGDARLDGQLTQGRGIVMMGPASFHYLAGFGGGGKLLAPGLADRATAESIHAHCLAPGGGRHPLVCAGVLSGNPLRDRIDAICDGLPPQFLIVPLLDSAGRTVALFSGNRRGAFGESCRALKDAYGLPRERGFRTIVACSGGAPYDLDFVQAHKVLEVAASVCEPGGEIVWVARCREGLPPRHREFLRRHADAASMERALRERFDIAAHTVWAARLKAERFRIVAVTEIAADQLAALGMTRAENIAEALGGADLANAALLPFGARFC